MMTKFKSLPLMSITPSLIFSSKFYMAVILLNLITPSTNMSILLINKYFYPIYLHVTYRTLSRARKPSLGGRSAYTRGPSQSTPAVYLPLSKLPTNFFNLLSIVIISSFVNVLSMVSLPLSRYSHFHFR
jgi:hypothetical protein